MCAVCDHVRQDAKLRPDEYVDAAVKLIAGAIESGKEPCHFDALLDEILGTGESQEVDAILDEAWERGHRG